MGWIVLGILGGIIVDVLRLDRKIHRLYHTLRYKLTNKCCSNPNVIKAFRNDHYYHQSGYICKNCFNWRDM